MSQFPSHAHEFAQLVERFALGFACSALIAGFARKRGSLTRSGALAALAIGTLIYVGGGGAFFALLVTFFVTSTLLGKVGRARKADVKREFAKGDTRDALQAFANGGVAALCAVGMLVAPHPAWAAAFVAALATANADTWATELGVLSRAEPWSLTRLTRVPRGTSGAVSALGLTVTCAGGLAIGGVAALAPHSFGLSARALLLLGAAAGFGGALCDSMLGATIQAQHFCPRCLRDVEGSLHACGTPTKHVRGLAWLNNDMVNAAATFMAALVAGAIAWLLGQ